MPNQHSPDNYTIPGGQKIFFNDGTGERDLGNIADLSVEHVIEMLEHITNRSGERLVDKTRPITRKLSFPFSLDEPNVENLRFYFCGGAAEGVGEQQVAVVDRKVVLSGVLLNSIGAFYGLSAVSVKQFLDGVVLWDESAQAWLDHSLEAETPAGVSFEGLAEAADKLYLVKATKFKEVTIDLDTLGDYGAGLTAKYWNGAAWSPLVCAGAGKDMEADGKMTFTPPADWATTTVGGKTGYAIELTAAAVNTPATVKCMMLVATALVDYVVDYGRAGQTGRIDGKIGRVAAGVFADGEEVKVSFTHTTWTSQEFAISTGTYVEGSARVEIFPGDGLGVRKEYIIPRCQIQPNGQIKEDDKAWELTPYTLTVLSAFETNPDAPYGKLRVYDA